MAVGKKLVIVESPVKAKKIGTYLGDEFTVLASKGHIRDLAQPSQVPAKDKEDFGKFGVDVEHGFKPYYIVDSDKKQIVTQLKKELKNADELYLATDEDREGEAIAWHLAQILKPKIPVKRMVFHEITKEAIGRSLSATRDIDASMVDAQETRRVLDRLYGYELSPVLWRKISPGLSAGRVQSVATRMIVERERERMNFVSAQYWDASVTLQTAQAEELTAQVVSLNGQRFAASKDFDDHGQLTAKAVTDNVLRVDKAQLETIAESLRHSKYAVAAIDERQSQRRPLPPFTTSTLQQAAGNRLKMSSQQTMRAAQSLYENGYITYMRTDSVVLSQEAITAARHAIAKAVGAEYLYAGDARHYVTKTAGAQEAHEAIRPAGAEFKTPDEIDKLVPPDQARLYRLIWLRTLASQMANAECSTVSVDITSQIPQGDALMKVSGTVVTFSGYLAIWNAFDGKKSEQSGAHNAKETQLPAMTVGQSLQVVSVEEQEHNTQPPARYTEASLVETLEAKEIGRPSTYATIISTIIDRGYVYEKSRALVPSWLAFVVVKLLENNFATFVDYQFTASMEQGLDEIAHGEQDGSAWLRKFYFGEHDNGLHAQVANLGDIDAHELNTIPIGGTYAVRVGRYGPYIENSAVLDANGNPQRVSVPDDITPDELTPQKADELYEHAQSDGRELGVDPITGYPVVLNNGRFGYYVELVEPEDEVLTEDESASAKKTKGKATKKKPKRASLFKSMDPNTVTLEEVLPLLALPREVGRYEETDEKTGELVEYVITAANGPYGPYLAKKAGSAKADNRSLTSEDEILTITLEQAKAIFAQPKRGRRTASKEPLRVLGTDPVTQTEVVIKDGFYGAYITDGTTNCTVPKSTSVETITPDEAFAMLEAKRQAGPTKKRRTTRKSTSKKSAPKTSAKRTTKKSTATSKTASGK